MAQLALHHAIDQFLGSIRRRLQRRDRLVWLLGGISIGCLFTAILPLLALLPGAFGLLNVSRIGAGCLLLVTCYLVLFRAKRNWRSDLQVARYAGSQLPALSSDLISTVELSHQTQPVKGISAALVQALADNVAQRVDTLNSQDLVPHKPLRVALMRCGMSVATLAALVIAAPTVFSGGWDRIFNPPAMTTVKPSKPRIADIQIQLEFPRYTNREHKSMPVGSGDIRVLPGTTIRITANALIPVTTARILRTTEAKESLDPIVLDVSEQQLSGIFVAKEATKYQFELTTPKGDIARDHREHGITLEADKHPEIELYAPADELDATDLEQIELAFVAEDDYGVIDVHLVWESSKGTKRIPLQASQSATKVEGKYIWDLAGLALAPGEQVTYHAEATDNDPINGPKHGKSKTFRLRIYSPRERHESLIERQRRLFETMIRQLATHLTLSEKTDLPKLNKQALNIVTQLAQLVSDLRQDELAAKPLIEELDQMRIRVDRLTTALTKLLKGRPDLAKGKLKKSNGKWIIEYEDDVITIADWLDRQQMELLLAMTDDIRTHQERIDELLAKWKETGSDAVRAQLQQEIEALQQKFAELATKRKDLGADVIDQFVNADALKTDNNKPCLEQAKALIAAGKMEEAQAKMQECSDEFETATAALEDSLDNLRGEKFAEEQKALSEMMNEIESVAQEQKSIADEADKIWDRAAEKAKHQKATAAQQQRLNRLVDRIERRLTRVPENGLTKESETALKRAKKSLQDVRKNVKQNQLADALASARQANSSLETAEEDLQRETNADQNAPWSTSSGAAHNAVRGAVPMAKGLADEISKLLPPPDEMMNRSDKQALQQLGQRQQALQKRTQKLQQKGQNQAGQMPGKAGKAISEGMQRATQSMEKAKGRMQQGDALGGRQHARNAAEQLNQTKNNAQNAARHGQQLSRNHNREPIRIPRAEEHKPPKEFREELLEAMKNSDSPAGFQDLVKRYYRELIR